ncbi:lipoyl(octanoyl) transferase LipB [Pseudobacteriovorax antillogorgiicola]|uniref:Octanoyltransferase n=1 Tax=Pseudobacteriovorax antillogorgiicola TaxID=1513793 RepID=A0A1Y6CAU9_9BACT|nr:lipoyl(octanoyl) transferase LipB [Pseudobacteriovorax antillogorgiicola]TCS49489.1 lipoyl(octanoyl) transferase [Pseudobacteriovorax antillogorgiicola]SMF46029.1 lipoyl(octanoyl) transferase [Pseudobacteriovorax antillogorgiicola]
MTHKIVHEDFPSIDYLRALERQHELHQMVLAQDIDAAFMTLQHPPVLTLGKHASSENFLRDRQAIAKEGVAIVETDRGGEVTAHMPGQLVVYPIVPLKAFGLGPRALVDDVLLGSVIRTLRAYGIEGRLDCDNPGVWVEDRKICAVGVRISRRVSTHGIALNVDNDMSLFDWIIPCGISNKGVTSMSLEKKQAVSLNEVQQDLLSNIYESLGITTSEA